ncbi:integrin beta-1-like isoform X1 [Sebastes umbrosus]|uniref:integrin beta-1-like isoform X1 n=1 Tax=Sebastes umbrosus TaxID=72105 RepID=UPI00189D9875|nr:integrin beta-1-like isoform X1 [Sebastes umbrosus]
MSVKLLGLCLLLVLLCPSWAEEQTCLTSASNCDECIQSGPACAWCTAPQSTIRCHTLKGLRRAGCRKRYVYNPEGMVQADKNDSSSTEPANAKALFLQPQEFSIRLRPGVSQSFPITITMPTDQPITELIMDTSPVPAGVNMTFSSIMNGNHLVLQVNIEAAQCPSESDDSNQNRTGPWSVQITPRGFSLSVKLEITLECQCDCTRHPEESSPGCSGHGALVCGQCECHKPYTGQQCQEEDTDSIFSRSEDFCRSGPNAPLCSSRGKCVEGFCECEMRVNPQERYSGQFCECSNFDCLHHNGRICGGHGRCECGRCICDDDWTGEGCVCSMETASCMATNQRLCNDRGSCQCGMCKCEPPYAGPTCEECPVCTGRCEQHKACVECRAFGTGAKRNRCDQECGHLSLTVVETKDDMPKPGETIAFCKMVSSEDSCFFYYTFSSTPSGGQWTVVRAKECPGD